MRGVGKDAAAPETRCPDDFAGQYACVYRVAFRLTGDAERSARITRESLAGTGAAVVPRAPRVGLVRACRRAAAAALEERDARYVDDERARLRAAVRALPGQQRIVFMLIALAGVPSREVERVLALTSDWCASQYRVAERTVCAELGLPALPSRARETPSVPVAGGAVAAQELLSPSRGRRQLLVAARGAR